VAGRSYRDLLVWQRPVDLVDAVYATSRSWPGEERFGLTNQVRRAVVSISANVAEGQGRERTGDFLRHLEIAHGSLYEVETHLTIASRLGYLEDAALDRLLDRTAEVGKLIHGLMRSLRPHVD